MQLCKKCNLYPTGSDGYIDFCCIECMHNGNHTFKCFKFSLIKNPQLQITFFDDTPELNYWLSNHYPSPITDHAGKIYPTANHYYQSCKFEPNTAPYLEISSAKISIEATMITKKYKNLISRKWDRHKVQTMMHVIREKFTQSKILQKMLIDTQPFCIFYFSPKRNWGFDLNRLGTILMTIRAELSRCAKL
uniref:NADAR domain-containing protein n=1 Tax=viral metagenome TaxID=1070528 RepID=A0A6C0CA51_9ZZZZ